MTLQQVHQGLEVLKGLLSKDTQYTNEDTDDEDTYHECPVCGERHQDGDYCHRCGA